MYFLHVSSGHKMSAKIAEWASWIYIHVFCGAKRQFLELCLETYIKMSGHSARSCLHLAESGQNKIDVTPHDWSVYLPWVQTGFEQIWVMRKMTKPRLTVDIKIPRTPLMESIFIYVWENHLIRLWFQSHCKRSSGSWIRRHGVRVPLLWPMYHILLHSIQYRL